MKAFRAWLKMEADTNKPWLIGKEYYLQSEPRGGKTPEHEVIVISVNAVILGDLQREFIKDAIKYKHDDIKELVEIINQLLNATGQEIVE